MDGRTREESFDSTLDERSLFLPDTRNDNLVADPDKGHYAQDSMPILSPSFELVDIELSHPSIVYANSEQSLDLETRSLTKQPEYSSAQLESDSVDEHSLPFAQFEDSFQTDDNTLDVNQRECTRETVGSAHVEQAQVLLPVDPAPDCATSLGPHEPPVAYDHTTASSTAVDEHYFSGPDDQYISPYPIDNGWPGALIGFEEIGVSSTEAGHSLAGRVGQGESSSQSIHASPPWTTTPSQRSRSLDVQPYALDCISASHIIPSNGAEPKDSLDGKDDASTGHECGIGKRSCAYPTGQKMTMISPAMNLINSSIAPATDSPRTNTTKQPTARRRSSATGVKRAWEHWEKEKVDMVMSDLIKQHHGSWSGKSWEQACQVLREQHKVDRTWRAIKNEWSRYGRKRTGLDERNRPEGKKVVTGYESPSERKAKRQAKKLEGSTKAQIAASKSQSRCERHSSTPYPGHGRHVRKPAKPKAASGVKEGPSARVPSHVLPSSQFPNDKSENFRPRFSPQISYDPNLHHAVHLQHPRPTHYSSILDRSPQQYFIWLANHQPAVIHPEPLPLAYGQHLPSYATYSRHDAQDAYQIAGKASFEHHDRQIEEVFEEGSEEPLVSKRKRPYEQVEG